MAKDHDSKLDPGGIPQEELPKRPSQCLQRMTGAVPVQPDSSVGFDVSDLKHVTADLVPKRAISRILGQIAARGYLTLIGGPGGVTKSTFAGGLSLAAAGAKVDLGHPVDLTDPKRGADGFNVTILALEDGQDHVDRCMRALMDRHGPPRAKLHAIGKDTFKVMAGGRGVQLLAFEPETRTVVVSPQAFGALREMLLALDTDMLVIDPMKNVYGGIQMTNEAMNVLYEAFSELAVELDIAIVCVAHTRKPSAATRSEQDQHDIKFGTESVDTARAVLNLNEVGLQQKTDWRIEPHRTIVKASVTKTNIGPKRSTHYEVVVQQVQCADGNVEQVPAVIRFDPPKIDGHSDKKAWPHIRAKLEAEFVYGSIKAKDENGQTIAATIRSGYEKAGMPKPKVTAALQRMTDEGWIVVVSEINPEGQNKHKVQRAKIGPTPPE